MQVRLLTGKGGVGKTSLSLATAFQAAEKGHRVFVLSTDAAHSLADALGRDVGPDPVEIAPRVTAQEVSALAELDRAWSEIQSWLQQALLDTDHELWAEELLVFPGLEELVSLRAIRDVEATGEFDLCIVDCAPTGSTLRLLRLPDVLRLFMDQFWSFMRRTADGLRPVAEGLGLGKFVAPEEVFAAFERLYEEVEDVREILLDEQRTRARLVLNPARVVVDETRRSFAYLSLYGVGTDAVLVNRVLPAEAHEGYFERWAEKEREELDDIARSFPVPLLQAPLRSREPIGVEALRSLGRELYGDRDPAERFVERRPLRIVRQEAFTRLEIDFPTTATEDLAVEVRGDELWIGVRDVERRIALPASLAGLPIERARMADGVLQVTFPAPERTTGEDT